jgi:hypothetical protein
MKVEVSEEVYAALEDCAKDENTTPEALIIEALSLALCLGSAPVVVQACDFAASFL